MSDKLLQAPVGIWGGFSTGDAEQKVICCFNNSGVVLTHGDVVVIDNSAGQMPAVVAGAANSATGAITTTTTAKDPKVAGVVSATGDASTSSATIGVGGTCYIVVQGVARVNVGAGAAALLSFLQTSATAKQAVGNPSGSLALTDIGTIFGVALEAAAAKDANNTIRAWIRTA